jgi:hypothetical protein
MNVATTAALAALVAIMPFLLSWLNGRQLAASKQAEWAHQDAIAAAAAADAQKAAGISQSNLEANQRIAASSEVTLGRVNSIHTLVNSDRTASLQGELDATAVSLLLLRKVIALNEAAGRPATPDDVGAVNATVARIATLRDTLANRIAQTKIAEQQAATAAKVADSLAPAPPDPIPGGPS